MGDSVLDKGAGSPNPTPTDAASVKKCAGCGKELLEKLLSCPTCIKISLPPTLFCSQDCFKENWGAHKLLHRISKAAPTGPAASISGFDETNQSTWFIDPKLRRFAGFDFTGSLRPWPQTGMHPIPSHIEKPDYAVGGYPLGEARVKSHNIVVRKEAEIQRLRETCLLARQALDLAHSMIRPGVTTDSIDEAVHNFIVENNAYPSPWNYHQFPKSCCTSVNEVICHGIPDMRPLQEGDIVNVDITTYYKGMHGDLNETFLVGEVNEESKNLVKGSYECLMKAIAECRPGVAYREIGPIVSKVADAYKLSVVRSYCGHGIGELFHTTPNVPHYKKNKAIGFMRPGHVFTIEPMLNMGHFKDVTWPDDWTAVTADGKRSSQFEHTLLITETGVEILTARLPCSPPLEIDVPSESAYFSASA